MDASGHVRTSLLLVPFSWLKKCPSQGEAKFKLNTISAYFSNVSLNSKIGSVEYEFENY